MTSSTKLPSNPSANLLPPPAALDTPLDNSKPKKCRFNKSLWKHAAEGITALHKFDILAAGKYSSMHHNA